MIHFAYNLTSYFSYVSRVQQYHDFDPFLYQPQPSNPWISDDTTIWTANANW